MATQGDLAALRCAASQVPRGAVVDGPYGDATQWLPALTGLAVTRPHQHVSLFDETGAALSRLPAPSFRFAGERLRYGEPLPAAPGTPLCGGSLIRLQ
jgi:hypothetical protein